MDPDATPSFRSVDARLLTVAGIVLFVVVVWANVRELAPEWVDAQDAVRAEVTKRLGAERAADLPPSGLQQIWIEGLTRADRCTTCHVTIEWGSELADAPHPARSHPRPELLAAHPPERFGCTLCHGGQGAAVSKEAAHGTVEFWEEPLLDTKRAKPYGLTAAQMLEMRCNACHMHAAEVEGMPVLNQAKAFVAKRNRCARCHTIFGEGGTKGPDLSREGEKHPTQYTFPKSWSKPRTAMRWHIQHFLEPGAVVPDSTMATFILTEQEAAGLALLVLSWREQDLPAGWLPRPPPAAPTEPPPK